MAIQTTSLDSKLDSLEQKATEYDTRTNTEQRVSQAQADLKNLNRVLSELEEAITELERQTGILTEVFDGSHPPEATNARDRARSVAEVTQNDVLDIIDDSSRSLSTHIDEVRDTREAVVSARRAIDDRLKTIQTEKLADVRTAKSIQKIVGEDQDAMRTISQYRSFLNSILSPNDSVSGLKTQWRGLEKAFQNLDTDWEGFRRRHGLSQQTISDLKNLSRESELNLKDLSGTSVNEMQDVPELRSTIKVSL